MNSFYLKTSNVLSPSLKNFACHRKTLNFERKLNLENEMILKPGVSSLEQLLRKVTPGFAADIFLILYHFIRFISGNNFSLDYYIYWIYFYPFFYIYLLILQYPNNLLIFNSLQSNFPSFWVKESVVSCTHIYYYCLFVYKII